MIHEKMTSVRFKELKQEDLDTWEVKNSIHIALQDREHLQRECDNLDPAYNRVCAELNRERAARVKLQAMLSELEWADGTPSGRCCWCGGAASMTTQGHRLRCRFLAALKEPE